jgi:hypothetical protein
MGFHIEMRVAPCHWEFLKEILKHGREGVSVLQELLFSKPLPADIVQGLLFHEGPRDLTPDFPVGRFIKRKHAAFNGLFGNLYGQFRGMPPAGREETNKWIKREPLISLAFLSLPFRSSGAPIEAVAA